MSEYLDQVLGSDFGSWGSDQLFDQEEVKKLIRKIETGGKRGKKRKGKKRLKKLQRKLLALEQEHQQFKEMEKKLHRLEKSNEKKRGKNKKIESKRELKKQIRILEQARQQQQLFSQEVLANVCLKLLGSAAISVNWPLPQGQPVIELPPPRGEK